MSRVIRPIADIEADLQELKNDLGRWEQLWPYERSYTLHTLHDVLIEFELAAALTANSQLAISPIEELA